MQLLMLMSMGSFLAYMAGKSAGGQFRGAFPQLSAMKLALINVAVILLALMCSAMQPVVCFYLASFAVGWSCRGQNSFFVTILSLVGALYSMYRLGGVSLGLTDGLSGTKESDDSKLREETEGLGAQ